MHLKKRILCCAAFLALASGLHTANAQDQERTFTVNGRTIAVDSFDRQVNAVMDEVGVPGLSLALIDHNRVVYFNTFGYRNLDTKDKVDKHTLFEACSLSKSFLVFATYRLVDEGKLDLDRPMYQYLPYEPLEHDPRYKLITPRMVLSHCSGIENWKKENNPDTLEILSDPGKKYIYSGEGYQYLAQVIGTILHEPYEKYIREMVFEPLKLENTICKYEQEGKYPTDYATGYTDNGKEITVWKNLEPVPASGIHTVAGDYARLIVSLFDSHFLSYARTRDVLTPMIRLNEDNPSLYYGPGFEVLYGSGDTLISHGGNNPGFKAQMFYSVVHQCGLVMMTNGNLGKLIARRLVGMSTGFDIDPFFQDDYYEQYPCNALALFKVYREKNGDAMLKSLEELKQSTGSRIGVNTLNQLGDILASCGEIPLAKKLAEQNTVLYPESSQAFYFLGEIDLYMKDYKPAYACLTRAKALHYNDDPGIDYDIRKCSEMIGKN